MIIYEISDIWIVILLSVLNLFLTGLVFVKISRFFAIVNAIIMCSYSIPLYYNLLFYSSGGIGLVWWFYLLIALLIHLFVLLIYLTIKFIKRRF